MKGKTLAGVQALFIGLLIATSPQKVSAISQNMNIHANQTIAEKNGTVQLKNTRESRLMIPVEACNELRKQQGLNEVTSAEIPTVDEVNAALKHVIVSKSAPRQIIDLKNGHELIVEVGEEQGNKSGYRAVQNITAYGKINYRAVGVTLFSLAISENYSYDNSTRRITSFQNPPSVSAPSWIGWSSEITNRIISNIDPSAKDAVADAKYTLLKYGNSHYGHMELRFTGVGNYYVHDSYFN